MAIEPTAQDQYMLELLNRARLNPQAEANRLLGGNLNEGLSAGTISTAAKQPLAINLKLFQAARSHTQWMLDQDTFAHAGANGTQVWDRAKTAGYDWRRIGENLAWRGTTGTPNWTTFVGQEHDDLFIDTGIAGRGHRTNMMDPNFREVGISSLVGPFTSNGTTYNGVMSTQNFGTDAGANPFLTGVVYTDKVTNNDFYTVGEGLGNITINAVGNGQTFTTTSMTAGGYSLRLAAGTYSVTFRGDFDNDGVVDTSIAKTVTIANQNIKQDFASDTYVAAPRQPTAGNDILTGTNNADTIDALAGNDRISGLGGNDILAGGAGNDTLDGGVGADKMNGGIGDDTYIIDNVGDIVTEAVNGGTDIVRATVNYTLAINVEQLYLVGNTNGIGNGGNNTIVGEGVGNNIINGGVGNDTLTGGVGNDTFAFSGNPLLKLLAAMGVDSITDFAANQDKIQLSKSYFTAVSAGTSLAAADFSVVTTDAAAAIAKTEIVYNPTNGHLFYNADLTTAGFGTNGGQFAQLTTGLSLANNNFTVVA
jgi:serralysin